MALNPASGDSLHTDMTDKLVVESEASMIVTVRIFSLGGRQLVPVYVDMGQALVSRYVFS